MNFKLIISLLTATTVLYACISQSNDSSINSVTSEIIPILDIINSTLSFSEKQSLKMASDLFLKNKQLPRTFKDGTLITSNADWWCSGFFPGTLWYLYENSHNPDLLKYARHYTSLIDDQKNNKKTHDIGFMINCSFGNGYRITGDEYYKKVMIIAAHSLITRYDKSIGLICSWNPNKKWQYPVIIDNMMNLELLMSASRFGFPVMKNIAISHADKTMKNHYRTDYSCWHVVSYDTATHDPLIKQTHQGYSDDSSWSRGQSWGLYGFVMMYRKTKSKKYLVMARNIADFLIHHPNMPEDFIPYWDYNAPGIPNALRDVSSGAIMASALIELSIYTDIESSKLYLNVAEKQIRTMASLKYRAVEVGDNGNFILRHGVGSLPHNSEVDVPLSYADYYFIEAMIRYKKLTNNPREGEFYP